MGESMFNKKSSFRSYAFTFILGAITGAALGLLYAPMTGMRMQKKVGNAKDRVVAVVEDSVDNVQSALRKVANA
jgi:gas vesicle protein